MNKKQLKKIKWIGGGRSFEKDIRVVELRLLKRSSDEEIAKEVIISANVVKYIILKYHKWLLAFMGHQMDVRRSFVFSDTKPIISIADLSPRIQNLLKGYVPRIGKIKELEDLAKLTEEELLTIKGMGRNTLSEIKGLMKLRGVSFR